MNNQKQTARIAGILYILVVITGPFVLIYIPNQLYVAGDATATANNILTHEMLFRSSILLGLFSNLAFGGAVLYLYFLLRDTGPRLALIMALLIFMDLTLAFRDLANDIATLKLLQHGDNLSVFTEPQRNALATLMMHFERKGTIVLEMFWGLWLLPLGILVYRSGFIAKFIGVWLLLNGAAYMIISFTGILLPEYSSLVFKIATPALFGEVALALWLVIVGVKTKVQSNLVSSLKT